MKKDWNCPVCEGLLEERLTKAGVFVDVCNKCSGYWLDQGELNFFSKSRKLLFEYEKVGLQEKKSTTKICPKCTNAKLMNGNLPFLGTPVAECSDCYGLFFQKEELVKLNNSKFIKGILEAKYLKSIIHRSQNKSLLSFALTSYITISLMYAFLVGFVVLMIELDYLKFNVGILSVVGFVLFQFIFGPILLDWSLRLFGSLEWASVNDLPKHFAHNLITLCREHKLIIPKFGIIDDGSPQAYTYGRSRKDARIIFSRGMFDLLNEEELKAVLAHELGHIKNRDFILMSIAQLVPLIFYQVYRVVRKVDSSKKNNKSNSYTLIIALISYAFYVLTEYLVLFISRLREYHADRFSSESTKNPNALITALTKIGLGLALNKNQNKEEGDNKHLEEKKAVQSFGIMNIAGTKSLLLSNGDGRIEEFGGENLKEIMKWDLWNPWAGFYELSYPVKLKGKIIGRGDSGFIFSEDLVLQDDTGIIYLNHEPFGFNLFFALKSFQDFKGEEVEVYGWYRRNPIPFIEIRKISTRSSTSKSFTKIYKELIYLILLLSSGYLMLKQITFV